jgi:hypothetical protein
MPSVRTRIIARTKTPGSVFVPSDFLRLGSRAAVDQALSRLVREGVFRRLARGIYDRPRRHPRLGALSPSLPLVAAAIARATRSRLQVSGLHAANQLGLSTQVPARLAYLTDGSTRAIRVGGRVIEFRHASPRTLVAAGTAAGVVIQALRYVGRDSITPDVVARVRKALRGKDRRALGKHVSRAPTWMRPPLLEIAKRGRHARVG